MRQQVVVATPALDGRVSCAFMNSILDARYMLLQAGIPHIFRQEIGDCFIAKVRNKLLTQFLEDHPDATDLFFIDEDVGFPADAFMRLLARPEEIVCGAYPKKQEDVAFPVALAQMGGKLIECNDMFVALLAPGGFMRIKREVCEALAAKATKFSDFVQTGGTRDYYNVFECGRGSDGRWWGEDYVFCKKANDAGYTVWVDPNIEFRHRGNKTWKGRLGDHIDAFRSMAAEQHQDMQSQAA